MAGAKVKLGRIKSHEDILGSSLADAVLLYVRKAHGREVERECRVAIQRGEFAPMIIHAEINTGRWIVKCPVCPGAQMAHRTERWFFCTDCLNQHIDSRMASVNWPDESEVRELQRVLMDRPVPLNRNWKPGETVEHLERENAARGVGSGR